MKSTYLFIVVVSTFVMNNAFCQSDTLQTAVNQMYLNVYTNSPTTNVKNFLDKYVPNFYKSRDSGGWVAFPDTIPTFTLEIHSLIFDKHPFFDGSYNYGRFTIKTKLDGDIASLRDVQVQLCYDSESKALEDYNKLFKKFNTFGNEHFISNEGIRKIEFVFNTSNVLVKNITILLTHDLLSKEYKITFLDGEVSYRMRK